jgi:hypothetical protein
MRSIFTNLYLFIILLLCISCTEKSAEQKDNLVFRYNENAAVNSLDPAFTKIRPSIWVANQLFNGSRQTVKRILLHCVAMFIFIKMACLVRIVHAPLQQEILLTA